MELKPQFESVSHGTGASVGVSITWNWSLSWSQYHMELNPQYHTELKPSSESVSRELEPQQHTEFEPSRPQGNTQKQHVWPLLHNSIIYF